MTRYNRSRRGGGKGGNKQKAHLLFEIDGETRARVILKFRLLDRGIPTPGERIEFRLISPNHEIGQPLANPGQPAQPLFITTDAGGWAASQPLNLSDEKLYPLKYSQIAAVYKSQSVVRPLPAAAQGGTLRIPYRIKVFPQEKITIYENRCLFEIVTYDGSGKTASQSIRVRANSPMTIKTETGAVLAEKVSAFNTDTDQNGAITLDITSDTLDYKVWFVHLGSREEEVREVMFR